MRRSLPSALVLPLALVMLGACAGGPAPGTWSDDLATLDPIDATATFSSTFVTLTLEVSGPDDDWPLEPCGVLPAEARREDPNAFSVEDLTCQFAGDVRFTAPSLEVLFVATDPIARTGTLSIGGQGEVSVAGAAAVAAVLQGALAPE